MGDKEPENIQVIKEIETPVENSPIRISWAELSGEIGVDIRKFWGKPAGNGAIQILPTSKGIRVSPRVFRAMLSLRDDKAFMEALQAAINVELKEDLPVSRE